jgi:hypothetical protein
MQQTITRDREVEKISRRLLRPIRIPKWQSVRIIFFGEPADLIERPMLALARLDAEWHEPFSLETRLPIAWFVC